MSTRSEPWPERVPGSRGRHGCGGRLWSKDPTEHAYREQRIGAGLVRRVCRECRAVSVAQVPGPCWARTAEGTPCRLPATPGDPRPLCHLHARRERDWGRLVRSLPFTMCRLAYAEARVQLRGPGREASGGRLRARPVLPSG